MSLPAMMDSAYGLKVFFEIKITLFSLFLSAKQTWNS